MSRVLAMEAEGMAKFRKMKVKRKRMVTMVHKLEAKD